MIRIREKVPNQIIVQKKGFDPTNAIFDLTTNEIVNKPNKAIWSSDEEESLLESGWICWALGEKFELKDCIYKVIPKKDLNVAELETVDDFVSLPKYSIPITYTSSYTFDYSRLENIGYDGLHITWNAAALGRGITFDSEKEYIYHSLRMFDCESTVWFNNTWIDHIECLGNTYEYLGLDKEQYIIKKGDR